MANKQVRLSEQERALIETIRAYKIDIRRMLRNSKDGYLFQVEQLRNRWLGAYDEESKGMLHEKLVEVDTERQGVETALVKVCVE